MLNEKKEKRCCLSGSFRVVKVAGLSKIVEKNMGRVVRLSAG